MEKLTLRIIGQHCKDSASYFVSRIAAENRAKKIESPDEAGLGFMLIAGLTHLS